MFQKFLSFLLAHWQLLLFFVLPLFLAAVCSAITKHYGHRVGLARFAYFVLSVLSVLRSAGEWHPVWGKFKLPGVPEPPLQNGAGKVSATVKNGTVVSGLLVLLLPVLLLSGCVCSTPRKCIATVLTASGTASELAIPALQKFCEPNVKACPAGSGESCPAYKDCIKLLDDWKTGMAGARKIIEGLNAVLAASGVQ